MHKNTCTNNTSNQNKELSTKQNLKYNDKDFQINKLDTEYKAARVRFDEYVLATIGKLVKDIRQTEHSAFPDFNNKDSHKY